jgi:hypothetical protein
MKLSAVTILILPGIFPGHIALQLHKYSDNFIRFKDIEIRMVK